MPAFRTRSARARLTRGSISWAVLGKKIALGYRASKTVGPGRFLCRVCSKDGRYRQQAIGLADDLEVADGHRVFDYGQASAAVLIRARQFAGEEADTGRWNSIPMTVSEALARYCTSLESRGGRAASEARSGFRKHVPESLAESDVSTLTDTVLQHWARQVPPRVATNLKAAMNVTPSHVRPGLAVLRALNPPKSSFVRVGREHILSEAEVAAVVAKARAHNAAFGLFVAVLAATGARPGQVARMSTKDIDGDVLLIPPAAKGKPGAAKAWARVPIVAELAAELHRATHCRTKNELLFRLPRNVLDTTKGGLGWRVDGWTGWTRTIWAREARAAGIRDGLYQLRHAAAVRLITAGVPLRVVAAALDTSAVMLERVYSRHIGTAGEAALRAVLPAERAARVVA
jgi:integrase